METAEVSIGAGERLKNLIARFVLKGNYWGYLFSRIRRRSVCNFGSIMGVAPETDGTITLIYDPNLLMKTEDNQIIRVIEHEGMHLLNKHISRLLRMLANEISEKNKQPKVMAWNIAADCSVNVQANIREPLIIDKTPWPPCLPGMYNLKEGKVTEEYFYELLKQAKQNSGKQNCKNCKNKNKNGEDGKGNQICENCQGDKDGDGFGNQAFDDHKKWSECAKDVADLSALSRKVDSNLQTIIRDSAKTFKSRGSLPSHISQLIEEALKPPKAPYYQIIRKLVRGSRFSKFRRSPTKINRKRTYVFTLGDDCVPEISPFPGKTRDMTFDIVVLIDTSGSMGNDDILEGLSGIKNIIEKDRNCHTTVLEVDAGVEKEYIVKRVRDIQFKIKGRGGTSLRPGLERARQLGCDVCLAFTDGFTEDINSIPRKCLPKKLIWIITPNGTVDNINRTGYVVKI